MKLEKRRIGTTNVEVSNLGFGGGPMGRPTNSHAEAAAITRNAWGGGMRYFDTAPLYGRGLSEKRIGSVLSKLPREEFVLSTKVGRLLVTEPGKSALTVQYDYSYDGARRSLETSLERLGLDRVDILLCHDPDIWTHGDAQPEIFEMAVKGILPALNDLRNQGVIKAFGLGINESQVCIDAMNHFDVVCFMLAGRFTLLEQDPLDDLLPICVQRKVSVIIAAPYNSGMLATSDRNRATYDYKPVNDTRWQQVQAIRQICDNHGVDIRAAALQYPLKHKAVAAVIPGSGTMKELQENYDCFSASIPNALWSDLDAAGLVRILEL